MVINFIKKNGPWGDWDDKNNNNNNSYDTDQLLDRLNRFFNRENPIKVFGILCIFFLIFWLLSGIYIVGPEQESLEFIFGKYRGFSVPGLRYHLPYPIGKVHLVTVTRVRKVEIGTEYSKNLNYDTEKSMLTKDENIVEVNFNVHWKISNSRDYLFNFGAQNAELTLKSICESSMRKIIGSQTMEYVLKGSGRAEIAEDLLNMVQKYLDSYRLGILIVSVQIEKIDPPVVILDAFRDVQSAKADKEKMINDGYTYKNSVIPEAEGFGIRLVNEAKGYAEEYLNIAKGSTSRFLSVYDQYLNSKYIVKRKMYFDTLDQIAPKWKKNIVDKDLQNFLIHKSIDRNSKSSYLRGVENRDLDKG